MIQILKGNTINLDPQPEDECFLNGQEQRTCTKFSTADKIKLQWKQIPCGPDLNCNPDFTGTTLYNDIIGLDQGWTSTGDIIFNAGKATFGGVGNFQFPLGSLAPLTTYRVCFTIEAYQSGGLTINIGSAVAGACGTDSITYATLQNGRYCVTLQSCDVPDFATLLMFDSINPPGAPLFHNFTVSDVEVSTFGSCILADSSWNFIDDGVIHSPGAADALTLSGILVTGKYYMVEIDITGRTQGSLDVMIGHVTPVITLNDNGRWYAYGYAQAGMGGNTDVALNASIDFDGIVGYWSVKELPTDYLLQVQDLDGNFVADISAYITYFEDRLFVNSDPSADWGIFEGCYQLALRDPCDSALIVSETISNNFNTPSDWSGYNEASVQITGGFANFTFSGDEFEEFNIDLAGGIDFSVNGTLNATIIYSFLAGLGESIEIVLVIDGVEYPAPYTGITITAGHHTLTIRVKATNVQNTSSLSIDSILLSTTGINPNAFSYVSSCFQILGVLENCEKEIKGVCTTGSTSLGFIWDGTFDITHRWPIKVGNASYDIDGGTYTHSTGEKKITSASREIVYQARVELMDDNLFDTLTTQMLCDEFSIEGIRYVLSPKSIKPEWDSELKGRIAAIKFELTRRNSTTFYKYNG